MVHVHVSRPGWLPVRLWTFRGGQGSFPGLVRLLAGGDERGNHVLQVVYSLAHGISRSVRLLAGGGFDDGIVLAEPAGRLSVPGRAVLAWKFPVAFQPDRCELLSFCPEVGVAALKVRTKSRFTGCGMYGLLTFLRGRGRRREERGRDAGWPGVWESAFRPGWDRVSSCWSCGFDSSFLLDE